MTKAEHAAWTKECENFKAYAYLHTDVHTVKLPAALEMLSEAVRLVELGLEGWSSADTDAAERLKREWGATDGD